VLDAAARKFGFTIAFDHFDWNCDGQVKSGHWMPDNWKEQAGGHDAIYFGAAGWPALCPTRLGSGIAIRFRRDFDQYVNLRRSSSCPASLPARGPQAGDIDYFVVRENTEASTPRWAADVRGHRSRFVTQQACFTRKGVEPDHEVRLRAGSDAPAETSPRRPTKSNGIAITMPYWDERFAAMSKNYPGVKTDQYHIDGLTIQMVLNPQRFDVIRRLQPLRPTSSPTWVPPPPAPSASRPRPT